MTSQLAEPSDSTCYSFSNTTPSTRVRLFGAEIDVLTMRESVQRIQDWLEDPNSHCRFVVTPNVDHAVMLQTNEALRRVYADAHLVLADGLPIIVASRLLGKPLPERVAGSELVPLLFGNLPPRASCDVSCSGRFRGSRTKRPHGSPANIRASRSWEPTAHRLASSGIHGKKQRSCDCSAMPRPN